MTCKEGQSELQHSQNRAFVVHNGWIEGMGEHGIAARVGDGSRGKNKGKAGGGVWTENEQGYGEAKPARFLTGRATSIDKQQSMRVQYRPRQQ
jgi:hypothetical protein